MADSITLRRSDAQDERDDDVRPPVPRPPVTPPHAPLPQGKTRRRWVRPLLFALLPVALVIGGYVYVTGGQVMSTDNAYVHADIVGISTDVSGIVRSIGVHDNQQVAKGEVLFRLDDLPMRLALERAEARVGTVKNELGALQASYRDMQTKIRQAEADVAYYQVEFERQQKLSSNNFASKAAYDDARHRLDVAKQDLASLRQQLAGIAANLNGDPDQPIEQHPRYKEAVAARDEAARQLSHTVVKAPMGGIVTNVPSLQVGDYLEAADPAFSLVSTDHVWVEASPKETELTNVQPGQMATIWVDTYPGETWRGRVESISPASSSSFSLLPAQNTSGNWVKVVQRIPMRISVDADPAKPTLRAGMSVEVEVDTGHARGLPTFLTDLFGGSAKAGG